MSALGRRTWSAIAVLLGALLVLTGLTAPANAAVARSLGLSATPTSTVTGAQILFQGHLTKSPQGSTLKIQRKVGSTWYSGATVKTLTADGYFAVKVTAPSTAGTASYRAVAGASSALKAATSATVNVSVLQKVTVTIKASKTTIGLGDKIVLSGTVKPFVANSVGFIQRFNGARWIDLTTVAISKTGTFKRTVTPAATTTYRLFMPKQGRNATGFSVGTKVSIPSGPADPVITTTEVPAGFTDTPYSKQLQVTGLAGTWAVTDGALPPGLTLSSGGLISGTPTAGGDFSFVVTFSQTSNLLNDSQPLSIHVSVKPRIITTALDDGTRFRPYADELVKTGQAGTWSITSGALPAGITLDPATGALTGKPTVAGSFPLTVKFTETASGLFVTKNLTLEIAAAPQPVITTASLLPAFQFTTYGANLAKTGLDGTWAITSGSLPTGLSFDTTTGAISGKPTVAGDFPLTFTFTETDSGFTVSKDLPLHVNAAVPPVITTNALPAATAFASYSTTVGKTGNDGTWEITAGTLPTGLSFDTATGAITGKPTVAGDYPLTFTFTETDSGLSVSKDLPLHVNVAPNPVITTTSLPLGFVGTPYSQTLTKTGNDGTWTISSGALPNGLQLNGATGAITGTPTTTGTFAFTVKFTETESGTFATKALQIAVFTRPVITTTGLADIENNASYNQTLQETGGSGSGTWALAAGTLPTGLSLNATTGAITGKSTQNGTKTFTVKYTDNASGASDTQELSIEVVPPGEVAIYSGTLPDGQVGVTYNFQFTGTGALLPSWSVAGGALPPGMTLLGGGQLTGKPTQAGDYTFLVKYTSLLDTNTKTFTLHVAP